MAAEAAIGGSGKGSNHDKLLGFVRGKGEIYGLIEDFDWSTTSLGPILQWPQSLKTSVGLLVRSPVAMVLLWGEDGVMIYNDAYSEFAGGRHPALLGSKVREGWPEVAAFNDHVMRTVLAGQTLRYTAQELVLHRHGAPENVWMDLTYSPVPDESGHPAGVIAIVIETTERVLADRRLAAQQQRLQILFEQAPSFMAMYEGPQHICSLSNAAHSRLVGYRDLIGHPLRDVMPELEGQDYFEILETCFRTGRPFVGNGMRVNLRTAPHGLPEDRYIDFVYQPVRAEDGTVTGIFLEGSDVTERVLAERAVRETEARFREVANAAPVLIWMADTTRNCTWFNSAWLSFTGRAMEQEIGFGWIESVAPDDRSRCQATYEHAFDQRQPFRMDYGLRKADGTMRMVDDIGVPRFAPDGSFLGYIGSCVDVTDARQSAAELRDLAEQLEQRVNQRTAELEAANRLLVAQIEERETIEATLRQMQRLEAVGQLTAGVAHDFNNLLMVVLGNIRFISRKVETFENAGTLLQRLDMMRGAAERGAKLTAQLLAFSRRQRLESREVDLNETIGRMRELLVGSLGGGVRLETTLRPDVWPALVDATQIELVILNLVINARDAMQAGGRLLVETNNVRLGPPRRPEEPALGEYVMVSVADTGSGMAPEILARAFEPFFTTKPVGKGSGLGLAQVYGFAKQSGGGVSIETSLGQGTVVRVYVPRADRLVQQAPAADMPREQAVAPWRVLLVDDDNAVREVTTAMLRELGCVVIDVPSGRAALEILGRQGERPDLMVVDFAMPMMNGLELAREVRRDAPDLPILFVTGYADLTEMEAVSEDIIVQKPFDEQQLQRKIQRLLARAPA